MNKVSGAEYSVPINGNQMEPFLGMTLFILVVIRVSVHLPISVNLQFAHMANGLEYFPNHAMDDVNLKSFNANA